MRFDQERIRQWPDEVDAGRLSSTEIGRWSALAVIRHLREVPAEQKKAMTQTLTLSMTPRLLLGRILVTTRVLGVCMTRASAYW